MLLWMAHIFLSKIIGVLRLFNFITFRAIFRDHDCDGNWS